MTGNPDVSFKFRKEEGTETLAYYSKEDEGELLAQMETEIFHLSGYLRNWFCKLNTDRTRIDNSLPLEQLNPKAQGAKAVNSFFQYQTEILFDSWHRLSSLAQRLLS
ncbi:hypothetical protein COLO4_34235 [Corchorus olitorius]|uniref:Uncharacterized protein n=1 Tax=Corchorus olitorius TaxID=93759 RepID=A0A1R3GMT8_9ROSI|nr:hypothetical protein COLO4_34235 [Corchorus olitorius]